MTNSPTLRDRIAAAIWERQNPGHRYADCEYRWQADAEADADAVLAVLPPPADRAAVLRVEADRIDATRAQFPIAVQNGITWATAELRRHAAETAATETEPGTCGHRSSEGHPCNEPPGHFGYHRNARQGGNEWTSWVGDTPVIHEDEGCGAEPPDGWPGDCWCTLAAGHEGPHRCGPCSTRHDAPGWSDEPAAGEQPEHCAHCGQPISRVTGTLAEWWVHDPGGNTFCHPDQAASSPRATPKPADETATTESHPCRTFVSGGTVWCCEEGETDCPCVCHQPADGARQDKAQPSTPPCTHCNHPKGDHDGRSDHRAKHSPLVAGDPWCHACNAPCDYTAAGVQEQRKRDAG